MNNSKRVCTILCAILLLANAFPQPISAYSVEDNRTYDLDKTEISQVFSIDGETYIAHEKYVDGILQAIRIVDQNGNDRCVACRDLLSNAIYVSENGSFHTVLLNRTQIYPDFTGLRGAWTDWLCNTYNLGEAGTFTALGLAVQLALLMGGVVIPDIVSYASDVLTAAGIDDRIWIHRCVRYKVEDGYQYVNQRITAYFNANCTGESVGPFETLQRKALDAKGRNRLI